MKANTSSAGLSGRTNVADPVVILLVEDEPFVREVTREVLTHGGYTVIESASPEEALYLAAGYPGHIDLLLTDVVMPGMNGSELAHHLQSRQPDLVTVFMSGYAEADIVKKLKRTSAIHIQKPFTVDAILGKILQALHSKMTAVPVAIYPAFLPEVTGISPSV